MTAVPPPVPPEIVEKAALTEAADLGMCMTCEDYPAEPDGVCLHCKTSDLAEDVDRITAERDAALALHRDAMATMTAEVERLRAERDEAREKLAALREHTLDSNPALRALHDQAVLYRNAVQAYGDVHGPLSTTLEWVIRHGSLSPKRPDEAERDAALAEIERLKATECIDCKTDRWHEGGGRGQPLHEYLDMSWSDYTAWVEDPHKADRDRAVLDAEGTAKLDALARAHSLIDQMRGDREPSSVWSLTEWEDWSNEVATALPEDYDGDESQESIILNAVRDMAEQLADRDRAVRDARRDAAERVGAVLARVHPAQIPHEIRADLRAVLAGLHDGEATG